MALPFAGAAAPLQQGDISAAALALGCDQAAVQAVLTVETGGAGGFLSDGSNRPRILFEAEHFGELTAHHYDAMYPTISTKAWDPSLYIGGAGEYGRLAAAASLDRTAALKATSWGLFQVMGENAISLGWLSIEAYVSDMAAGEGNQLRAFVAFCLVNGRCCAALRQRDWAGFAEAYNGPSYAANAYDQRLARAYAQARGAKVDVLQIGAKGGAIALLQQALNTHGAKPALLADGVFGRVTELAVERFQRSHKLMADGVVGPATGAALGLS